jgi:hypothetical protein
MDPIDKGAGHRLRFVVKNPARSRTVTQKVQRMVDVSLRRLDRQERWIAEQKEKIERLSGADDSQSVRFRKAAERKLAKLEEDRDKTWAALEILKSNDVELSPVGSVSNENAQDGAEDGECAIPQDRSIGDAARQWADEHGVKGFVDTIDIDGEEIDVINMHMARYGDVRSTDGIWPSFFSMEGGSPKEAAKRRQQVKDLLAAASPDMERMVGILTTPGMLHMVDLEALTLRGHVVEVSNDPEVREKGLDLLKDFVVVDAEAYTKNFKK